MTAMYTRQLEVPDRSFFLFGPRGTGKTTWLSSRLPDAIWFDLLQTATFLQLLRSPETFSQRLDAMEDGGWVVVDEVQRLPVLLDEIHAVMNRHPEKFKFAITGSSARKLKREGTNLLAGRAINRRFFPLTGAEMNYKFDTDELLLFGCLPAVRSSTSTLDRVDILEAYVANYLQEEIQQEAAVKQLDSFHRFLEIAALMNSRVTNVAGIARDAAVARPTVQGYFQVLIETLIGFWLPAWQPRAKVKERKQPKFYFFDTGVVRGIAGRLREPLSDEERGGLLETLILHELRSWMNVSNCGGKLSYWSTPSGNEIDLIWTRGETAVGIEVKAGRQWRGEFSRALKEMAAEQRLARCFGIYRGPHRLQDGPVTVFPVMEFMKELASGLVIG
jgi:predicted AAA+ superfamily ATPase